MLFHLLIPFLTAEKIPVKYLLLIKPGEEISINSSIPTNEFDELALH